MIYQCIEENCSEASSVVDDKSGQTCWIEPQDNATSECIDNCLVVGGGEYDFFNKTVCLDFIRERPQNNKIQGPVPAVLWSMGDTKGYPLGEFT